MFALLADAVEVRWIVIGWICIVLMLLISAALLLTIRYANQAELEAGTVTRALGAPEVVVRYGLLGAASVATAPARSAMWKRIDGSHTLSTSGARASTTSNVSSVPPRRAAATPR